MRPECAPQPCTILHPRPLGTVEVHAFPFSCLLCKELRSREGETLPGDTQQGGRKPDLRMGQRPIPAEKGPSRSQQGTCFLKNVGKRLMPVGRAWPEDGFPSVFQQFFQLRQGQSVLTHITAGFLGITTISQKTTGTEMKVTTRLNDRSQN